MCKGVRVCIVHVMRVRDVGESEHAHSSAGSSARKEHARRMRARLADVVLSHGTVTPTASFG